MHWEMIILNKPHPSPSTASEPAWNASGPAAAVQDQENWPALERKLSRSLEKHVKMTLTVDTPQGTSRLRGFVTVINTYLQEIKLREEDDWKWIRFEDIRSVQEA